MQADLNFLEGVSLCQIDNAYRTLIGDKANRVNANFPILADWSGRLISIRPTAAPVADVGLAAGDRHLKRCVADIKRAERFAGGSVDLG